MKTDPIRIRVHNSALEGVAEICQGHRSKFMMPRQGSFGGDFAVPVAIPRIVSCTSLKQITEISDILLYR